MLILDWSSDYVIGEYICCCLICLVLCCVWSLDNTKKPFGRQSLFYKGKTPNNQNIILNHFLHCYSVRSLTPRHHQNKYITIIIVHHEWNPFSVLVRYFGHSVFKWRHVCKPRLKSFVMRSQRRTGRKGRALWTLIQVPVHILHTSDRVRTLQRSIYRHDTQRMYLKVNGNIFKKSSK